MRIPTKIPTDCGHAFEVDVPVNLAIGCTTDCPECNALMMIVADETTGAKAVEFHKYMHERDERWPANGANTGYIEF